MNITKKIGAVTCAAALALTGMAVTGANPAQAAVRTGLGTGIVEVAGVYTDAENDARHQPRGTGSAGTGIVVPNVWGNNEVLTNYHVIEGIPNDGSIWIRIPGKTTVYKAYVQHTSPTKDLALLWIWGGANGNSAWPTAAPQFQEAALYPGTASPPVGMHTLTCGDGFGIPFNTQAPLDCHAGVVINSSLPHNYVQREFDGVVEDLLNTILTNGATVAGDSGGPMYACDPTCGIHVAGIEVAGDNLPGTHSDAIQIQGAIKAMLTNKP